MCLAGDGRGILRIVADVLREPMFSLLLAAGAIYLVLGDLGEAIVLLAFATLSVLITVVTPAGIALSGSVLSCGQPCTASGIGVSNRVVA
ncbi:MAG: hypothetical protein B7Z15_04290 [Rhizobiales bacterium 32-66-8]|nr:MAG: hypothetical protein B7Z15_04290 [Rhizobiales bacterium 32-66-8]